MSLLLVRWGALLALALALLSGAALALGTQIGSEWLVFGSYAGGDNPLILWDAGRSVSLAGASGGDPAWSADGRLAFVGRTADGYSDVMVWDGATIHNISRAPTEGEAVPAWSPDGRLAWATLKEGVLSAIYLWDGSSIMRVSGDITAYGLKWTNDRRLIWETGAGTAQVRAGETVLWSPDGRGALRSRLSGTWDVYLLDDGVLTNLSAALGTPLETEHSLTWSPGCAPAADPAPLGCAARLAWIDVNALSRSRHACQHYRVLVWDGAAARVVAQHAAHTLRWLAWSNGGRLAWEVFPCAATDTDIYIWDGGSPAALGVRGVWEFTPAWHP